LWSSSTTSGHPRQAGNFIKLARQGFYDGVIFHRVIPGFVVQGGDGEFGRQDEKGQIRNPGRVGNRWARLQVEDEPFTGDYHRGALAMANAGPNTNGSQFFICHQDPAREAAQELHPLRPGAERDDVIDAIAAAPRTGTTSRNRRVAMLSVTIEEA